MIKMGHPVDINICNSLFKKFKKSYVHRTEEKELILNNEYIS